MKNIFLIAAIISVAFIPCVSADTGDIYPAKYAILEQLIGTKQVDGIAYYQKNPNIVSVVYNVKGYEPSTYDYSVVLFTNNHEEIVEVFPLISSYGSIQLKTRYYQSGKTYWLNLMRTVKGDEEAQMRYCDAHGYPCEISKNLDIIDMPIGTQADSSGAIYKKNLKGYIRNSAPVPGVAWQNI